MYGFKNRKEAGKSLSQKLLNYHSKETAVLALPRGGVVVADEVAKALNAPLDLVIAQKIGHPLSPEYAIAAISKEGHMIGNERELSSVSPHWLEKEKSIKQAEAQRRYSIYLAGRKPIPLKGKIAIIVDDGIATGLTMRLAIEEVKKQNPKVVVVAVPVASQEIAEEIRLLVDDFIGVFVVQELGAVGAFYDEFKQVSDEEVIAILSKYK